MLSTRLPRSSHTHLDLVQPEIYFGALKPIEFQKDKIFINVPYILKCILQCCWHKVAVCYEWAK